MEHLIKTFGRRHGKQLSAHKHELMGSLLPKLLPGKLPADKIKILEIGFGGGEHILHLAQNPNYFVVGCEPFINGVASLLTNMTGQNNVAIWPDDVRIYMNKKPGLFDMIYILHPDPWPKARHEKKRLLQTEFLNELDGILSPGGVIILGTDHEDYFNWAISKISSSRFILLNKDRNLVPTSGLTTRYQKKNKFGSAKPFYAVLARRDDLPSPERLASFDLTLA